MSNVKCRAFERLSNTMEVEIYVKKQDFDLYRCIFKRKKDIKESK